jgi:trimeric autotransporter adhesin
MNLPITSLRARSVLGVFALGCCALCQISQAVSPPPDGGYPGGNTAEGTSALLSRTSGGYNTAVGLFSLLSLTDGNFNTGVGAGTLLSNTADLNTATGAGALLSNVTGSDNTANGAFALFSNTTGSYNTATGVNALSSNTEGLNNNAFGWGALTNNVSGNGNTAVGYQAAINANGSNNTALGAGAGLSWGVAGENVCIGQGVTGSFFDGAITRIRNIGTFALGGATNVVIASIGGIGDGELGYNAFSRRYYEDIQPVDKASETLFALKPVSFRGKNNIAAANVKLYGLIAEDVATVDPDLVVYNSEGQPETLRLESINAMLLNEFLKEHLKVQQQEDRIVKLEGTVGALTAQLREQAAQIQKVRAQTELSRPSARTVLNDR